MNFIFRHPLFSTDEKNENQLNYLANEEGVQNTIFSTPLAIIIPPPDQRCNFLALFMRY